MSVTAGSSRSLPVVGVFRNWGVCADDDLLDAAGWHAGDLNENSEANGGGSDCDQVTSSIENKFSKYAIAVTLGFH